MPVPQLVKVYSQRRYLHTTLVQHQGTTVAFAMDDTRRIFYSVLDMSRDTGDAYDTENWGDNPRELKFPNEIAQVGYAAAGAAVLPTIKRGGRVEASSSETLRPDDIDPFLSTTARLGAAAPFQVVSDGTNVLVFRQSIDAAHADMVFKLPNGTVTGTAGTERVAVVDNTLLCDRFILAGSELRPLMEVRYQRSRQRTRPESYRDTLSTKDMDGYPFYEPTQELTFVRHLTDGAFTILLLPTQVTDVRRWQLFARNGTTQRIDAFNIEQSADGLFNTMGSQFYTSPDPAHTAAVFERRPGTCPFTGKPLVPVASKSDFAQTALRFSGTAFTYVNLHNPASLTFTTPKCTVEAWIRPTAPNGTILTKHDSNQVQGTFTLALSGKGTVTVRRGGAALLESDRPVPMGTYCHIAVTFDGDRAELYLDGVQSGAGLLPIGTLTTTDVLIGAQQGGAAWYNGEIDEIRVWNRTRSPAELARDRCLCLIGNEPGLIAYYRFDEGSGTTLFDRTDNRADGTVNKATWVTSHAPIGDRPGMRRDSFTFADRTIVSGLTATLYFQQENAVAGYATDEKPLKKQARVLLAGVTAGPPPPGGTAGRSYVATLDFAVGRDGRLAQVPDRITLPAVGKPATAPDLDRISALEQAIKALQTRIANDEALLAQPVPDAQAIAAWQAERTSVAAEVARLQAQYDRENTVTNWTYRIRNAIDNSFMTAYPAGDQGMRLTATMDPREGCALFRIRDTGVRAGDGRPYYLIAPPYSPGGGFATPLRVSDARPGNNHGPLIGQPPTGAPDVIFFDFQYMSHGVPGPEPGSGSWARFLIDVADASSTEGEIIAQSNGRQVLFRPMASGKDYPGEEDRYRTVNEGETVDPKAVRFIFQRYTLPSGVDVTLQTARDKLSDLDTKIDDAQRKTARIAEAKARIAAAELELAAELNELAVLTGGAQGSADTVLPMPYLGADRRGLSYAGGLLAFAWTPDTPFLADSTVGHVALYFRGGEGQFFAAYYDTTVSRSSRKLATDTAPLRLVSRDALIDLTGTTVVVTDGDTPQRCTVTITTGTEVETFRQVPRTPVQFASVLNGDPDTTSVLVGLVQQADAKTLTLAEPTPNVLPGGSAISVGDKAFLVAAHTPAGAKSLTVVAGDTTGIAAGTEIRSVFYAAGWATATRAGVSLHTGSTRIRVDATSTTGSVVNGSAAGLVAGRTMQWRAEAPGRAFSFDGKQNRLALPAALLPQTAAPGDFTLEAWILPDRVPDSARVLHANTGTGGSDSRYTLGVAPAPLLTALTFDDGKDRVDCGPIPLGGDFTIEFLAKRQAVSGRTEFLVVQGDPTANNLLHIGFRHDNTFVFGFFGNNDLNIATAFTDLQWHHWAAVYDRANGVQILYRDGEKIGQRDVATPYGGGGDLYLAGWPRAQMAAKVRMDEVRVWSRVRSAAEIYLDMGRRVGGRETGLLRCWSFAGKRATDRSPAGQDGQLVGNPSQAPSSLGGHQVFAALGDRIVRSRDAFPTNEWEHLALTVRPSWAIRLDGGGYLDAGRDEPFNIVGDLTLEVFTTVDRIGLIQGLASFGSVGSGESGGVPYQLQVLSNGILRFSFVDLDGNAQHHESTRPITVGAFHRLAVVRKGGNEIHFYIDGDTAGTSRYEGSAPQGGPGPLEFGRVRVGSAAAGLRGTLSEVRLWRVARSPADVCREAPPRSSGLVAHWRFQENSGYVTVDTTGTYRAELNDASWTRSPDPAASPAQLYRNGEAVVFDIVGATDDLRTAGYGDTQFTIGGRLVGGTLQEPFSGVLEEVRVWHTLRTQEQILDNLFTRLKGERDQLIACYSFDLALGADATSALRDSGLRGNDLEFGSTDQKPRMVLSTAPLSTDTAQVRSALSGVSTAFQDRISNIPAATEYADAQIDHQGRLTGVMKRCYSYRRGDKWYLITGYKIGNLVTEWIGQAQFDPQIIGYIEGAPPVPSENLTGSSTADLTGTSSVAFRQSDSVTVAQASNSSDSTNFAFEASLELSWKADIRSVAAPLGVGITTPLGEVAPSVKFGGGYNFSHGWTSDHKIQRGIATTRATSVKLTGSWEDPAKLLNAAVGRRFLPANTGFAVVRSETVDLFAIRLAHNNALVSYRILPSPDIPRDWNLIPFPINPRYTKQGTLDGSIGSTDAGKVLDPDYPQAAGRGEYSYFKPTEAYGIKRRIQREQQRLRGLYASMSTTPPADPNANAAGRMLNELSRHSVAPPDRKGSDSAATEVAKSFARRDLANTYVWTAAGGFFAETSETTDVVSETMASSYTTGWKASGGGGLSFGVFGAGASINFELSGGASHSTTQSKSKDATRGFGLDVSCGPSGDLNRYDTGGKLVFDAAGRPTKVPGKVDAYRFMTFYLGSDKANFEDFYGKVVDPVWLAQSQDANAAALRQAQHSAKKPPCWRIMHRVTYISRILQSIPPSTASPLEKAMRAENIDSNFELIKRLEPYVRDATASRTELTAATKNALALHLPELLPNAEDITTYLAQYYGTA
ncbi:LamG-like jellyroll fold domain-containing protein [Nocardia sp. CC227C]|uniref:LamG-like jellyroll fold domain-containing protein n=1 Tax=Nocardia sp. CC227C TaxID=3044562 RepID=UPI00278BAE3B|nr:LamG-like jellyroll fold domain-containing protein [Nocardia sp. CC227C]